MKESFGKVRIAVALEYPLLQQGGTEVLVRELVRGLAERYEIVMVSGDRDREALGEFFGSLITAHLWWKKATASRQTARKLAQALVDQGIALAHFHSGGVYEWQSHKAWQSPIFHLTGVGVPCLVTSHLVQPLLEGFSQPDRPSWQKGLLLPKAWMSKALLMSRVETEILVSRHDQAQLQSFFPPFAGKLRQMYHSKLARDSVGVPPEERKKTVFCLGTFCRRKGQTILARAFALVAKRHPDWTLHMMGFSETPDYQEQVKEIIAHAGISDRVQISPPQNDPGSFLETASVFAMPSLLEGLGLSLQEALYYECACVGSDVGGIPELIENEETGLLIPPGDESALASALDRLMSEPELRARLSRRARQSIVEKGMLADIMVENHTRLYEAVLAEKKI
jgi:glycosyltransferase involved in cell wall biosynthesis